MADDADYSMGDEEPVFRPLMRPNITVTAFFRHLWKDEGGESEKALAPVVEEAHAVVAELGERAPCLLGCLLLVGVGLREELVGKAHDLFLHAARLHVPEGQGPAALAYLQERQPRAGVVLADVGAAQQHVGLGLVAREPLQMCLAPQQLGSQQSVADVGRATVAADAVGIGEEDADVVQQGGLAHERLVGTQLGMAAHDVHAFRCHRLAVDGQNGAYGRAKSIIFVNIYVGIHFFSLLLRAKLSIVPVTTKKQPENYE